VGWEEGIVEDCCRVQSMPGGRIGVSRGWEE
jgi:hypothetical protein